MLKGKREDSTVVGEMVEFFAYQYLTAPRTDDHVRLWWPVDGIGHYLTEEEALKEAKSHNYHSIRTMRVQVKVEYGKRVDLEVKPDEPAEPDLRDQ